MNKPTILVLCTGNSARSQMAEAFLQKHVGEHFEVHSAGTEPKGVNPLTVRVMEEAGFDMSAHRSKHLHEFLGKVPVHTFIVVCGEADKSCPAALMGVQRRLFWPFDDPAAAKGSEEERLAKFRQVRDQIERRVQEWAEELRQANERR